MTSDSVSDAAKAVVRLNTEEVQGGGNFDVFEELFADDFVDHATQPGTSPDKAGVRKLYTYMREAFPAFHAEAALFELLDRPRTFPAIGGWLCADSNARARRRIDR